MGKAKWVDYKEIKSKVPLEAILERYGIKALKRKGDELIGYCPIHDDKNYESKAFHANTARNIWNCFGGCGGGNILDLVAKMEGVEVRQAALLIQEWFGLSEDKPSKMTGKELAKEKKSKGQDVKSGAGKGAVKEKANKPLTFELKNLQVDHPYLSERGLSEKTVEFFGLGYCNRGLMKDRVAIPIHDEDGELVAYAGRWPGNPPEGEPKYKLPPGFEKSAVVFNLHRVKDLAGENELVVVEGFFDAFRVWQAGFSNVVALMGASMSEAQAELVKEAVGSQGRVILMFDGDEAGRRCGVEALALLSESVFVKVVKLKDGEQPDSLSEAELKGLLEK